VARTIAKDHSEKRTQILKSAAKVFASQGFDRASMNELAAECGISKANIYHYYESKHTLLFDMLDNHLSSLKDRICAIPLDFCKPEDSLREITLQILLAYQGADNEHRVQNAGYSVLPKDQQSILRTYQRDMISHLSNVIAACEPACFQGDPVKLRATTMSVFGMLNWYFMWQADGNECNRRAYAALVSNLTLKGLKGL